MGSVEVADLVVVELGTNDAGQGVPPAVFQSQYVALLAMVLQQSPMATLVGLACWRDPNYVTPSGSPVSLYNAIIKDAVLNKSGFRAKQYVDLGLMYLDPQYHNWSGDTFHPNDAGHQAIANAILSVV